MACSWEQEQNDNKGYLLSTHLPHKVEAQSSLQYDWQQHKQKHGHRKTHAHTHPDGDRHTHEDTHMNTHTYTHTPNTPPPAHTITIHLLINKECNQSLIMQPSKPYCTNQPTHTQKTKCCHCDSCWCCHPKCPHQRAVVLSSQSTLTHGQMLPSWENKDILRNSRKNVLQTHVKHDPMCVCVYTHVWSCVRVFYHALYENVC